MYWIAFGDIHENTSMLDSILELESAEGVIVSGDITNSGGPDTAQRILNEIGQYNSQIYAQIGNMDHEEIIAHLDKSGLGIHRKVLELTDDICIAGVGFSTPTPFSTPSEISEETLEGWLTELEEGVAPYKYCIFVCHTPPLNTKTDSLGGGVHVGSPAVRSFIERIQPDICITGHIHESRATDTIGKTTIINPGMFSQGGYVRVDYKNNELSARLETLA
ncbi:MAG: metallophosphoesterase [Desulfovibrio sp.]